MADELVRRPVAVLVAANLTALVAAIFDTDVNTEAAWLILAKHIIEAAKQGEHDEGRLRDGVLAALAQSNLRSQIPPSAGR